MQIEQLELLRSINLQLTLLIILLVVALTAYLVRTWGTTRGIFLEASEKTFIFAAEQFFEEGRYRELIELCEARLSRRPNAPQALWWCGRAHYELNHHKIARQKFERLSRLEPGWDEHVEPFLEKIQGTSQTMQ